MSHQWIGWINSNITNFKVQSIIETPRPKGWGFFLLCILRADRSADHFESYLANIIAG